MSSQLLTLSTALLLLLCNGFMHAGSYALIFALAETSRHSEDTCVFEKGCLNTPPRIFSTLQKATTFMNLQLHHVVTDITDVTGMKIMRAIVRGERDPEVLSAMRDIRVKASAETVRAALIGNHQPEHLFALLTAAQ